MWVRVDTTKPTISRKLAIVGTGHDCPTQEEGKYIGTFFDTMFVWHVFEEIA